MCLVSKFSKQLSHKPSNIYFEELDYMFNIYFIATITRQSFKKYCLGMACCGNTFTKNDGCCNKTTPFNKTHSQCVKNKVVPLGHDFCDAVLFDKQKQKCCEYSTLWNISSYDRNFQCCGSEVYDRRTKQCCKRKIQPKSGQCCGTGKYIFNSSCLKLECYRFMT